MNSQSGELTVFVGAVALVEPSLIVFVCEFSLWINVVSK